MAEPALKDYEQEQTENEAVEVKERDRVVSIKEYWNKKGIKEKVIDAFENKTLDKMVETTTEDSLAWMYEEDFYTSNSVEEAVVEQLQENEAVEEVDLGLVSLIKCEVLNQIKEETENRLEVIIDDNAATTDEFVKIQLWSYFPIVGSFMYFLFLSVIALNRNGKYKKSLQNWAKAQLKLYWVYLAVTLVMVFVICASGISLVHVIQRGLAY